MSDYSKTKQNVKNINGEKFSSNSLIDNREFFKRALAETIEMKIRKEEEWIELTASTSRRHKIQMNRLFREHVGSSFIPFPELDNLDED